MTEPRWARPYLCNMLHALIPVTATAGEELLAPVCAAMAPAALWDYSRDWLPHCPRCAELTSPPREAAPTLAPGNRHAPYMH